MEPPIHITHGSHSSPLQRHYWSDQDGQEIQTFRQQQQTLSTKQFISEVQGDLWGDRFATEVRGYQPLLHPDSKSIKQGFDGIYLDPSNQEFIVVEFKGQTSRESPLQRDPNWVIETCQKICSGQPPYTQVSDYERQTAQTLLSHHQKGHTLRYEVIRTNIEPTTGKFYSQLERRTYLEPGVDIQPTLPQMTSTILHHRGQHQPDGTTLVQGKNYIIQQQGQITSIFRTSHPNQTIFQQEGNQVTYNHLTKEDLTKFHEAYHRLSQQQERTRYPPIRELPIIERSTNTSIGHSLS
jgi:hypothetical protein